MCKAAGSPQGRLLSPPALPGSCGGTRNSPEVVHCRARTAPSPLPFASLAQAALQLLWGHLGMRLNRGFGSAILPLSEQAGAADGH